MPNFTENYNLKKPLQEEFYNIEDHNGNMDIIDTILKELSEDSGVVISPDEPEKGDVWIDTDDDSDDPSTVVTSVNGQTGDVTLDVYTTGQVDNLVGSFQSHINNQNNPHNVTAAAIGALAVNKKHYVGNIDEVSNGAYLVRASATGDMPFTNAWFDLIALPSGTGAVSQIAMCASAEGVPTTLKFRHHNGSVWSPWSTAATTDTATKIQTGSYVGTGTSGVSNPCSLTFSFEPKMVCVKKKTEDSPSSGTYFVWVKGQTGGENSRLWFSANGDVFSWYGSSHSYQLNTSNTEYHWVAIG